MNDLLQYMFHDGFLTAAEVVALRKTCKDLHENPVRVLRSLNIARPEEIQSYIQRTLRIPAVTDRLIEELDESFKALIPIDIAVNYGVFAIAEENDRLFVAMEDPSDHGLVHKLEFFLNRKISPVSATVFQIATALSRLYEVSVEQMRLTTILESSRGVIAGARPKEVHALPVGNDTPLELAESSPEEVSPEGDEAAIDSLTARALEGSLEDTPEAGDFDSGVALEAPSEEGGAADGLSLEADDPFADASPAGEALPIDPTSDAAESLFGESDSATPPSPPAQDMSAGDLVFFDSPPAAQAQQDASSDEALSDSQGASASPAGDEALFDTSSEPVTDLLGIDEPALPSDMEDSLDVEELAKETSAATDPGSSVSHLSPGEVILFGDDSETPPVQAGEAVFFDSSAIAAETVSEQETLDLGLEEATKVAAQTSLAIEGLATIKTAAGVAPSSSLEGNGVENPLIEENQEASASPVTELAVDDLLPEGLDDLPLDTVDATAPAVDDLIEDTILEETSLATPEPATQSAISPGLDLSALAAQANSLLVKISMAPSRAKAVESVNAKLQPFDISFALDATGAVHFHQGAQAPSKEVTETLQPLTKRLERLRM